MRVKINSKEVDTSCRTVAELAAGQGLPAAGVAIAIANEMVPRKDWDSREIKEGDDIVVLRAFCGG